MSPGLGWQARAGILVRVRGFLPKTVSAQVLADVIRTVHCGGRYVDPELAADAISADDSPLTPAKPTSWNSRQAAPPSMKSRNARP